MKNKFMTIALAVALFTASSIFAQTPTPDTKAEKKAKREVIKEKIKNLDPAAKAELKAERQNLKQEVKDGKITKQEAKKEMRAKVKEEIKASKKK